jgi:hypothetical protein
MRLLSGAMAFFGGPVGLAIAGVTLAMTLLSGAMFKAAGQAKTLKDEVREALSVPESAKDKLTRLIERQTEALKKQEDRINSLNKSKATGETFERRQTGVGGFDAVEPVAGGDKFGDVKLGNKELLDLLAERDQTVKDLEALKLRLEGLDAAAAVLDPELGTTGADDEKTAIADLIARKKELISLGRVEGLSLEKLKASIALTAAERRDDRDATKGEKKELEELVVTLFTEDKARDALKEAQEKAKELHEDISGIEAEQQAMRELIAALKESEEEYKIVSEQQKILSKNQDIGAQKAREMATETVNLQDEMDELTDTTDDASNAFQELGATFSSAFEDAVVEAQKLTEVMDALFKDLFRIAFRKLATEPIFGGLADELGKATKEGSGGFDFSGFFGSITGGLLGGGGDDEEKAGAGTPTDAEIEDAKRARTIASLDELSTAGKTAATDVTNMSGTAASAANVLTGQLAAGAIETGVANKLQTTTIQAATSALVQFTVALRAAAAAAATTGNTGGGGSPGSNLITNSFGTFFGAAGRAEGGIVTGLGSSKSDSILTRLSSGEFVVNAQATSQNLPALEALNAGGKLPSGDMIFNIDGSGDPEATAAEVALMLQRTQGVTARQSARNSLRSARRLSGDGF